MSRLVEAKRAPKLGLMPTVLVTVAALYLARAALVPLAVAFMLSFMLAPAVTFLERWRLGRTASVLIVVGIVRGEVGAMR